MASDGGGEKNAENKEEAKDPKEGKRFFKFVFNVNKKATDETEMTAEFMNDVKHYHEYNDAVAKCAQYMENIFIPFGTKNVKEEDGPFLRLSDALFDFKTHMPPSHEKSIESFARQMKAAGVSRKSHQAIQSYHLRHMRKFSVNHFETFAAQKKQFDEARRKMDQAKADVRDAKTTTAIEKKAICYQMAVDDFDQQTEALIKIIDALPSVKQAYCHDILVVLTKHKLYHADMSKFFASCSPS